MHACGGDNAAVATVNLLVMLFGVDEECLQTEQKINDKKEVQRPHSCTAVSVIDAAGSR